MSHNRKIGDNRRLRKTYLATRHHCLTGVYYDERKGRLIREYQGRIGKFLRKRGNKKVRKAGLAYQCGMYRKVYDYWWEL